MPDEKGIPPGPRSGETGRNSGAAIGPDSYRYRYREKPDADQRSPLKLATITRTVVLASVAFGAILLYLVRDLGMDSGELLGYAKSALLFTGAFLSAGVILGALVVLLRRVFSASRPADRFSADPPENDSSVARSRSHSPD
jgi:hypothetical protein